MILTFFFLICFIPFYSFFPLFLPTNFLCTIHTSFDSHFTVTYLSSSTLPCIENYHCDVCNWKIRSFVYNNFTTAPTFGRSAANKKENGVHAGKSHIVWTEFAQYAIRTHRSFWKGISKIFSFQHATEHAVSYTDAWLTL